MLGKNWLIFFQIFATLLHANCSSEPLIDVLNNFDASRFNLSELCNGDLKILKDGIEKSEVWAIKVRDISGKKSTGFTSGNNFYLGNEKECTYLNDPPNIYLKFSSTRKMQANATIARSVIPLTYRLFYIKHASTLQFDIDLFNQSVIHVGLCFPSACSDHDASEFKWIFESITFNNSALFGNVTFANSRTLKIRQNFINESFVWIMIMVTMCFGILVAFGTMYTSLTRNMKHKHEINDLKSNNNVESLLCGRLNLNQSNTMKRRKAIADRFWFCFSLQKNYKFIMSPKLGKDSIPPIHGIRTFGIMWIIVGHIYYYAIATIDNLQIVFSYAESFALQPFFATAISVDSFYTLSGLLLAYSFYEKQKKRPSKNLTLDVLKGVIYRYIRIAPCMLILILLAVTTSMFVNDTSQFLAVENMEVNCKNYWWRNVLFIQNIYPLSEMCLSWSWYVSTDFQLFIISSVLLAISARNMKLCVILSLIIMVTCSVYSGIVGLKHSFGFSLDNQYKNVDELYTKLYTRAPQYLTGVWAGYYLSNINRQWAVRKIYVSLGWLLSIFTIAFLVFGQVYKKTNFLVSFIFPALGRTLWSLPICFMVIAGSTQQHSNGFIAKILNSKLLLPFSRMSFSAYLLNPLIVIFMFSKFETTFHADFYSIPVYAVGFYVITYVAAFFFMLFFENPIIMFVRAYTR